MNDHQVSSPSSEPTRQDNRREIGKRILAIVAFVLLLGGNLYLAGATMFVTAFLCMGAGASSKWYCSAPFAWGLIIGTVGVVVVSLLFINSSCYAQMGSLEMLRASTKSTSLSSKPSAVTV